MGSMAGSRLRGQAVAPAGVEEAGSCTSRTPTPTTVERARRHGNRHSMVQPGAWAGGRSRQLPRIMESQKNLHVAYTRGRSREDNGRQPEAPRTFGMPGRQIRATGSKSHKHRPSIIPILLVLENRFVSSVPRQPLGFHAQCSAWRASQLLGPRLQGRPEGARALPRLQANLPGSRKLAGELAMRNAILCGSGFERASEATSNFRITEDARGHGRSL